MVKKVQEADQALYLCEACGFVYKNSSIAQQCEDYCNSHKSCSREIAKHAIRCC